MWVLERGYDHSGNSSFGGDTKSFYITLTCHPKAQHPASRKARHSLPTTYSAPFCSAGDKVFKSTSLALAMEMHIRASTFYIFRIFYLSKADDTSITAKDEWKIDVLQCTTSIEVDLTLAAEAVVVVGTTISDGYGTSLRQKNIRILERR